MTTENLFEPAETPAVDATKDYYQDLVGPDKKFKTPADLARGKIEADLFVDRLKQENEGLRKDLNTQQRLEAIMDKLNASQPKTELPNPDNQPDRGKDESALTPEKLEALVTSIADKRDQERHQQANLAEVKQALTQHLGKDYLNAINAEASKLGLSKDELNALAASKPKAFLKLFGVSDKQQGLFSPPQSAVNPSLGSATSGDRTKTFYDELRKSNPSLYWSVKTQNQMHSDAQRLMERFYS